MKNASATLASQATGSSDSQRAQPGAGASGAPNSAGTTSASARRSGRHACTACASRSGAASSARTRSGAAGVTPCRRRCSAWRPHRLVPVPSRSAYSSSSMSRAVCASMPCSSGAAVSVWYWPTVARLNGWSATLSSVPVRSVSQPMVVLVD
ncbi:hypothetical protein [Pseudoduganella chitinolytica]|uniref:hypothetical protein n=1 Tax=Pseudoduganella chitinolytica TaxID=34070 RepID=UPI003530CC7E